MGLPVLGTASSSSAELTLSSGERTLGYGDPGVIARFEIPIE